MSDLSAFRDPEYLRDRGLRLVGGKLALDRDAIAARAWAIAQGRTKNLGGHFLHHFDNAVKVETAAAETSLGVERDREKFYKLSPHARLIRSLELRLHIIKHPTSSVPRSEGEVEHYESLLRQAKAAAPDSADVRLAAMVMERAP